MKSPLQVTATFAKEPCQTALILATGNSTISAAPLALTRLAGLSLAQHCIYRLQAAGIKKYIVILGHESKKVRDHFEKIAYQCRCHIQFVTVQQWHKGDGYCILQAQDKVHTDPFLLTSVDYLLCVELIKKTVNQPPANPLSIVVANEWNERYAGLMCATHTLFATLHTSCQQGDYRLAAAVAAHNMHVAIVDVTGLFWHRINTPADAAKVQSRLLAHLNKDKQDGFFAQYIGRAISSRLSVRLARTGLTPNQMTWIGFALMLFAAVLLAMPHVLWQLLGAALVGIACALDGCDGEVARLRCQQTAYGGWLDTLLDRYADFTLAMALTWSAFQQNPQAWVWLVGCLSAVGFILTSYAKKEYQLRHQRPYPHTVMARLGQRDLRIILMLTGAVLGFPFVAVVGAGLLSHSTVFWMLLTSQFHDQHTTAANGKSVS